MNCGFLSWLGLLAGPEFVHWRPKLRGPPVRIYLPSSTNPFGQENIHLILELWKALKIETLKTEIRKEKINKATHATY